MILQFAKYFFHIFLFLFVFWVLRYPGWTSPDTSNQWNQVLQFEFNDWHPVIHTLFIWLSTILIKEYWFALLIQNILFSLSIAYLGSTLDSWKFPKWIVYLSMLFITVNPVTINIIQYLWKDVTFAIIILLFSIELINIYLSDGDYLKQYKNIFIILIWMLLGSLIRHNGIFFTLPALFLILLFYYKISRKSLILLLLFFLKPLKQSVGDK